MEVFGLGSEIIAYLQSLGDGFINLMQLFSLLGDEYFFLLILPLIYWSIDTRLGVHIGVMLTLSSSLNSILKVAFHTPRPFWVLTDITAYRVDFGFGLPSGHAQNAVAIWGVIAAYLRKAWIWLVAVLLIFFIGFSRLALGAHFPIDVVSGWIVGAILLYIYWVSFPAVSSWYRARELNTRLIVTLAVSLVILLIGAAVTLFVSQVYPVPVQWETLAKAAGMIDPFDPYALDNLLTTIGVFFGLVAGYIMIKAHGGFETRGSLLQHLGRYVLGVVGVLILWYGLGRIFPEGQDLISYGLRYLRYALIGAWISWWAPAAFIFLGLSRRPSREPTRSTQEKSTGE